MKLLLVALVLLMPIGAVAQVQPDVSAVSSQQLLKAEELEALVAPIALYPDPLLSLVLMASTYPLEIVQAERWAKANKTLQGDKLKSAVEKQAWDESVKSLVATPDVLAMMSDKLDWTQKLGDAVLAQQPDVMDAIQRMRSKAYDGKKLASTKQQTVVVKQQDNRTAIAIEPTDPNTVYVPYYDPAVVYGAWPYQAYPPYAFPWPGYIAGGVIATGIAFGAGYALGRWASGRYLWGGGVNWGNRNLIVNRPVNINNIGDNWQHRPQHRHGVRYSNPGVDQKFGNRGAREGNQQRLDFRGRDGGEARPGAGADRPGTGERRAADERRAAGNRGREGAPPGGRDRSGRPRPESRPARTSSGPQRDAAFGNIQPGRVANLQAQRGRASFGASGLQGGHRGGFQGGSRGAFHGGAMRGGGMARGGRRSDIRLKHEITLVGRLSNGIEIYRFKYNNEDKAYVGVIAQQVQTIMPTAVTRGRDGYLRVYYSKLGFKFQSYIEWISSGRAAPAPTNIAHHRPIHDLSH